MAYLEFEGSKFWKVEVDGDTTTVTFGKTGSAGQTAVKAHGSAAEAQKFAKKMAAQKRKKGYEEANDPSGGGPPAKKQKTKTKAADPTPAAAAAASGGDALEGATICITGTLSVSRAQFTAKLQQAGATVRQPRLLFALV